MDWGDDTDTARYLWFSPSYRGSMTKMSQKYLFLCLISLLFISGCIDKPQTQAEKVGWDEAKYEEYSAYYEALLFSHDQSKVNRSAIHNIITNYSTITKGKPIEEWLIDIPKDKNEFEKAWYMVFYYFQKGQLESKKVSVCDLKISIGECFSSNRDAKKAADGYYQKATEYRQKIEDMKMNLSR